MLREVFIFVLSLHRECVKVEPVHERLIEAKPNVGNLRGMDVCVDKSRQHKLRIRKLNLFKAASVRVLPICVVRFCSHTNNLDEESSHVTQNFRQINLLFRPRQR